MASPTSSYPAEGNIRAAAALAAAGAVSYDVAFTTVIGGALYVEMTPGSTVAATAGLRVRLAPLFGSTPTACTQVIYDITLGAVASTLNSRWFPLSTGWYRLTLTNLDAANAIATVRVTSSTIPGIA